MTSWTTLVARLIAAIATILPVYFTMQSLDGMLSNKGRAFLAEHPELLLLFVYGSAYGATGDAVVTFLGVLVVAVFSYMAQTSPELRVYFNFPNEKDQTDSSFLKEEEDETDDFLASE